jgi:hypothetical protein
LHKSARFYRAFVAQRTNNSTRRAPLLCFLPSPASGVMRGQLSVLHPLRDAQYAVARRTNQDAATPHSRLAARHQFNSFW